MKPIFLFLSIILAIPFVCPKKANAGPGLVGVASVIPGLGQTINGDFGEGVGWFSTVLASQLVGDSAIRHMGFNVWMYNMYDAWRDAGGKPSKNHNVFQNYIASFNPANILDPIGAPIIALGAVAPNDKDMDPMGVGTGIIYYSFVGMGEEALFRGFLFPAFSSFMGKWLGATVSSVGFALVHDNSGAGQFIFRFLAGMVFCWQLDRNAYDLQKNIFAHTWYDVFVSGTLSIGPTYYDKRDASKFAPTLNYTVGF